MDTTSTEFLGLPKKAFFFSLALHLFLFVFLLTFSTDQGAALLRMLIGVKKSEISAQSFIQVDVVGLPDELINQRVNPLLPEVSEPSSKVVDKPTPKATEKSDVMEEAKTKEKEKEKQKKELERKRAEEKALQSAKQEAEREQALKGLQNKMGRKGRGKIKGNMLSEGTASSGMIGTAKDKYIGVLTESIKQQFNVFSWQQKKELVAEVQLSLLPNGRVRWRKITKPSRDVMYDSAVLQAIDDAQPFPVPEDKGLLQEEITINFKP